MEAKSDSSVEIQRAVAQRDNEWIEAMLFIDSQIAFTGDPKRYVQAVFAPLMGRADREAALAVKLRNLCEELKPGSSSHL